MSHSGAAILSYMSSYYVPFSETMDLLHLYEFLDANWLTNGASKEICGVYPKFCSYLLQFTHNSNPDLDDQDRFADYLGHTPKGASAKAIKHFAQNYKENRFQKFSNHYNDFTHRTKKRHTHEFPLDKISVPVAMFTGKEDPLADLTDSRWTRDQIGSKIVHYEEIHAGHQTFLVGKDMSYFTKTVMDLLKEYQPLEGAAAQTDAGKK